MPAAQFLSVFVFVVFHFSTIPSVTAQEPKPQPPLLSLDGHGAEVYTVCFSRDGRRIASAANREVKVWDATTGKELLNYPTRGTNVFGVAFHPDSEKFAVGVSHEVRIVDIATGKDASVMKCAPDFLFRIAFSPDGKFVAAAGGLHGIQPGTVHVWEADGGKHVSALAGHGAPALSVDFSGDGKYLVSGSGATNGSKAGEVCVWDSKTGEAIRVLHGHSNNVYGVAMSRDGRLIASASGVRGGTGAGELKIWELLTGKELVDLKGHTGTIFSVAFSPDGKRLATAGSDKTVRIWDICTAREILNIPAHSSAVYSLAFSPDGLRLATASQDKGVKVWQVPAPERPAIHPLSAAELDVFWSDLADEPARAHRAIGRLATVPDQTVPLFRKQLQPIAALDSAQKESVARWLRDLDENRFAARETASRELARLGEAALPALREKLAGTPSAEARKRIESLLSRFSKVPSTPEELRSLRAIGVLESIGNAEAKLVLKNLVNGVPGARITEEARSSLERIAKAATPSLWP